MDARQRDTLFGRMALRVGWITIEQLNAATEEQGRRQYPGPIGEVFVELGFLTPEKVQKLLKRPQEIMAERATRAPSPGAPEPAASEDAQREEEEQARQIAARARRAPERGADPASAARARAAAEAAERAKREAEEQARAQEEMQREIEAQLQAQIDAQLEAQLATPTQEPAPAASSEASSEPESDPFFAFVPAPAAQGPTSTNSRAALHAEIAGALDDESLDGTPRGHDAPPEDTSIGRLDAQIDRAMPIRSDEAPAFEIPSAVADVTAGLPAEARLASAWLDSVLQMATQAGASDVHLHAGSPIAQRVLGELSPVSRDVLDPAALEGELRTVLTTEQRSALDELGQVDLAYAVPGVARFRGNIYKQQRGVDAAFRVVPPRAPTLAELGLPQQIARVTTYHQGIVLFTGPAGCGKSSTMAAIVDLINAERTDHILTIEDPIEIVHTPKRAIVNQRHAGHHTKSYARALRGALREDPDVIVIGEMRDYETISLALKAAETGHLVLATLHTNSAARTINRVVGAFPPNQQGQARSMLSESLRAVISQRLVVRADRLGRVPALEVLYVNPAVGNLIRDNRTVQLRSVLQTQTAQGMCLLDASLADLIKRNVVTWQDAAIHAEDPRKLPGAPAGGA